ncbi:ATP-binding protein [Nonomuraea sp. NPDC050202]|uniref:sensor histidine kinase n=1 Tax=Nonomuraea sp. NPDC050202 TaxID=3155035 RepID=UPI0033EE36B1
MNRGSPRWFGLAPFGQSDVFAQVVVESIEITRSDHEDHAHRGGLADLPALAERSGGPELAVALEVDPRLDSTVHPETATCAYRIVQEALTNVARHSTAALASVTVRAVSSRVVVTIDGPGPPRPSAGGEPADDGVLSGERRGGQGLAGMRERVAALGGHCHTGPHGRTGWRARRLARAPPACA